MLTEVLLLAPSASEGRYTADAAAARLGLVRIHKARPATPSALYRRGGRSLPGHRRFGAPGKGAARHCGMRFTGPVEGHDHVVLA